LLKNEDIFPKESSILPPMRDIYFTIELRLGVELISKTPYQMTDPKLDMLQMSLKEISYFGFIRSNISP